MSNNSNQKNPESSLSKKPFPADCPFVKNGVVRGLQQMLEGGGLLERVVEEVRASNKLTRESNLVAKHNNRMLRTVLILFVACVSLLLLEGLVMWRTLSDVTALEDRLRESALQLDQLASAQRYTERKIDGVRKYQDDQTKVELVPEPDPGKAKDNPLKVRITPGKDSSLSPSNQKAVEVPLPVREVFVDPGKEQKK